MKIKKDIEIDKLLLMYNAVSELCQDYARMTDGYSLATGDNKFENMPDGIKDMIDERQKFFSYRNIIKEALKDKIIGFMKENKDE